MMEIMQMNLTDEVEIKEIGYICVYSIGKSAFILGNLIRLFYDSD